jgi:Flp pilus assembly protein TadB
MSKRVTLAALALLILSVAALASSTQPSRADSCSHEIDLAWVQVNAKIQARSSAGRSLPQSMIALLHRQPTQSSIASAQEMLVEVWLPMEMAVAALSRAREADRANDRIACDEALAEVRRVVAR